MRYNSNKKTHFIMNSLTLNTTNSNLLFNFVDTFKSLPKFTLNVIQQLGDKDQLSNALTCRMMHDLTTFPLGRCLFSPDEPRSWIQILQEDLLTQCTFCFRKLKLSTIVRKMPTLECPHQSPLSLPAPTVQFFNAELPKTSTEEYIRDGLCRKLFRNKYLHSVAHRIKDAENTRKSDYYAFYHACALSSFIPTEFLKCLIEVANTCGQNHVTKSGFQKIKESSWFRLPHSDESVKIKTVSDFSSRHPTMEKEQKGINDHDPMIQKLLMAIVPCLFSSLSDSGESAWILFEENRSVNPLSCEKYFHLLCDHFGLLPRPADRAEFLTTFTELHGQFCFLANEALKKIHKELKVRGSEDGIDPRGVITQIFVPHQIAEKVVYLAKPYGYIDHSLDHLSFADRMKEIITNPWKHSRAQFRILAHHLHNFKSGIVVKTHGYGDFFDSSVATDFRTKIHAFFLKAFLTTMSHSAPE